ncbi:hypothetical protein ACHAW6_000809 [Cyclotella cf. meneghiniana]
MEMDCKPVQITPMPATQPHPLEPQPTPLATKQEEMYWPTASGTKGKAQSLMSTSAAWTGAPTGTPHQAKSSSTMLRRKRTSMRQPASNDARTSPPLSTPSTAWQQRMREQPSDATSGCLQRSGAELTLTWQIHPNTNESHHSQNQHPSPLWQPHKSTSQVGPHR